MQVLYLILSLESDDTSIASFSAFPAFIVLTLKSCWLLPVWQKKHRSLFSGVSQLGVYIGDIAFLRNVYDGIPATPIKREGGNLNFI